MLKLKLQYFDHLMQRTDSLEQTLMLEKIEGRKRRVWQRMRWLDGITNLMYSCHLLISSAFVRSITFLSFTVLLFAWYVLLVSLIVFKSFLVFLILLFFFISLHCSLKKIYYFSLLFSVTLRSVGYIFPFLFCLSFLFFSQVFVRSPKTTICLFCIFLSWGWFLKTFWIQYFLFKKP